jgi:4-diphosphocytidyl-2-C-methyl-D-erythritol kinase
LEVFLLKQITVLAPAKINLGLDIIGRREDGYHLLKMIMQTVSLYDEVTVSIVDSGLSMEIEYDSEPGKYADLPVDDSNLCIKAAKQMIDKYRLNYGFSIKLLKRIPSEAGLAGGSADAAATMIAIRDLLLPEVTNEELAEISLPIGADVPYCILKGTMLAEGIGEVLTRLNNMPRTDVLLVKPDVAVSTGEAYHRIDSQENLVHPPIDEIIDRLNPERIESIGEILGNVFEDMVIDTYPKVKELKRELLDQGAFGALMSGSGSCCYGLFKDKAGINKAYNYFVENYPTYQVYMTETI